MKAIVQDRYGSPEVLELADVDTPVAASNEVLVRVHAAAVNAYDWHVMRGDPYIMRLMSPSYFGLSGPKRKVRGRDFAGVVEAVGSDVTRFHPGDEVYGDLGDANGAFAEYASVSDSGVEHKPANLTLEQAAAIPLAGSTALIGLRDVARVQPRSACADQWRLGWCGHIRRADRQVARRGGNRCLQHQECRVGAVARR